MSPVEGVLPNVYLITLFSKSGYEGGGGQKFQKNGYVVCVWSPLTNMEIYPPKIIIEITTMHKHIKITKKQKMKSHKASCCLCLLSLSC